jgi:hypothetical protein
LAGSVLAHDPGVGVAHFLDGVSGKACDIGVPSFCGYVTPHDAIAQPHQSVLDVAWVFFVVQVLADLFVG